VLVNAIPSRTVLSQRALYSGSAPLGDGSVNIVIQPAHTGYAQMHIYLLDAQGRADDHQESVSVELTQTDLDLGPISRPLTKAGPGHYQGFGKLFTVPGRWQVLVRVRVDEFTEHDATLTVPIRG
jgi:copper transport protein